MERCEGEVKMEVMREGGKEKKECDKRDRKRSNR